MGCGVKKNIYTYIERNLNLVNDTHITHKYPGNQRTIDMNFGDGNFIVVVGRQIESYIKRIRFSH